MARMMSVGISAKRAVREEEEEEEEEEDVAAAAEHRVEGVAEGASASAASQSGRIPGTASHRPAPTCCPPD
jgi:hypothetical protein